MEEIKFILEQKDFESVYSKIIYECMKISAINMPDNVTVGEIRKVAYDLANEIRSFLYNYQRICSDEK